MRTLTQADREIAAGVARAHRLNPGDVTKATPVRMLGDARFGANDDDERGQLFDAAHAARRNALARSERDDMRTRPARDAMRRLAVPFISEREFCSLVACLNDILARSSWSHTDGAVAASESLVDAHARIEEQAEKNEGEGAQGWAS